MSGSNGKRCSRWELNRDMENRTTTYEWIYPVILGASLAQAPQRGDGIRFTANCKNEGPVKDMARMTGEKVTVS